jgi:hypothetical protein
MICLSVGLKAEVKLLDPVVSRQDDSVVVTFQLDAKKAFPIRQKEAFIPYLHQGEDTLWFDAMEIYGRERYKREKQEKHLDGDRNWELGENQYLAGEVVNYCEKVPVKRWMKGATLSFIKYTSGCNCKSEPISGVLKDSLTLFTEPVLPQRRIPQYVMEEPSRQWNFGQDELEIIFKVSKAEIDSSVFDNEKTFGKILNAVDKIFANPHFKIEKIEIAGYASPEGRRNFNKWLGENRAKALIDYIITHRPQYKLGKRHFRIRNGEENWPGLRRHLLESSIAQKDQVVEIIDSNMTDEMKKTAIKAIDKGAVWKKMLDEVYPHLRCARYLAVFFESTDDHAMDYIHEGMRLIQVGEYEQAYQQLLHAQDDMRAYNSLGVSLMMQGRFEDAMPWFEKAVDMNSAAAKKNMAAIQAEYDYEAACRQEIENYLKKYE